MKGQIPERTGQGQTMAHLEAIAGDVISWTSTEGSDPVLRVSTGAPLVARRADSRFKAWNRAMSLQQQKQWPVYVEFEPATRAINMLLLCSPRLVDSVKPTDNGDVTVVFYRAPSFYHLRKDKPGFQATLELLHHAMQARTEVFVAVHPSSGEILFARAA